MAQTMNTGLADVAVHYLHFLQAKITPATVQKDLEENAWYPSLLSLSDTFSKYKIHNDAFEVDEANFEMLEVPFAAYIFVPGTGKDFVLLTKKDNETISYLHKRKKTRSISKEAFFKRFQNVVWLAQADEQSGQKDFQSSGDALSL